MDNDPWVKAYRIVCKKTGVGRRGEAIPVEKQLEICEKLFPRADKRQTEEEEPNKMDKPFRAEEVTEAARRTGCKKAPGPDGIAPEIIKAIAEAEPEEVAQAFTEIVESGEYPADWKEARLVLLPKIKDGKEAGYRPLCLLDCGGKMLERLITTRLQEEIEQKGGLAPRQYGFRRGRSTVDAIREVTQKIRKAKEGTRRTRKMCAVVAIDVENAFNTVPWTGVIGVLKERGISKYLRRIISSYLSDRKIVLQDEATERKRDISAGVPQGSVLGPTLWNVYYDKLLRVEMPADVTSVAYADDLVIVAAGKDEEELMRVTNEALKRVHDWMETAGLKMAAAKTEAMMAVGRRKYGNIEFQVGQTIIKPGQKMKYLGVMLDGSLSFTHHIRYACEKAERTAMALTRLMPKIGGPKASKRKLIGTAARSVTLYGAEIWAGALTKWKHYQLQARKVQRKTAIGVTGALRTVATVTVMVLAGTKPWDIAAEERKKRYEGKLEQTEETEETNESEEGWEKWQDEWDSSEKGRWTHHLIPDVRSWAERPHGEVDYWLSQFLTGHGSFGQFLARIGKRETPRCESCGTDTNDTAEHTILHCTRWDEERTTLWEKIGRQNDARQLVEIMVRSEEAWTIGAATIKKILQRKQDLEKGEDQPARSQARANT